MIDDKIIKRNKMIILGVVIVLILIFIFLLTRENKKEYQDKVYPNEDYVYTLDSSEVLESKVYSRLPYINIRSTDGTFVNDEVKLDYNNAVKQGNVLYTYSYEVSKNYLSIATYTNVLNEVTGDSETSIKTYIFDLNTRGLLTEEEVLKRFNQTIENLAKDFEEEMKNYFQLEIKEGYNDTVECDYNCFLRIKHIENYSDNISVFVVNDKLEYYRPFNIFSANEREDIYIENNEDFLFQLD